MAQGGAGNIKSNILRHLCRSYGKTLTLWAGLYKTKCQNIS